VLLGPLRVQQPLFGTHAASLHQLHSLPRRGGAEIDRFASAASWRRVGFPQLGWGRDGLT
jgi:hypothetical protein